MRSRPGWLPAIYATDPPFDFVCQPHTSLSCPHLMRTAVDSRSSSSPRPFRPCWSLAGRRIRRTSCRGARSSLRREEVMVISSCTPRQRAFVLLYLVWTAERTARLSLRQPQEICQNYPPLLQPRYTAGRQLVDESHAHLAEAPKTFHTVSIQLRYLLRGTPTWMDGLDERAGERSARFCALRYYQHHSRFGDTCICITYLCIEGKQKHGSHKSGDFGWMEVVSRSFPACMQHSVIGTKVHRSMPTLLLLLPTVKSTSNALYGCFCTCQ